MKVISGVLLSVILCASLAAQTTVSGTFGIDVSASDMTAFNRDCGVAYVQLQINGAPLGPKLTAPTSGTIYHYDWNTLTVPNGNYSLTAIAADKSGGGTLFTCDGTRPNISAPSAPRVIVVANPDTTVPTVTITQPIAGATLPAGKVTVRAVASDPNGIKRITVYANGAVIGFTPPGATAITIQDWNTNPYKGKTVILMAEAFNTVNVKPGTTSITVKVSR